MQRKIAVATTLSSRRGLARPGRAVVRDDSGYSKHRLQEEHRQMRMKNALKLLAFSLGVLLCTLWHVSTTDVGYHRDRWVRHPGVSLSSEDDNNMEVHYDDAPNLYPQAPPSTRSNPSSFHKRLVGSSKGRRQEYEYPPEVEGLTHSTQGRTHAYTNAFAGDPRKFNPKRRALIIDQAEVNTGNLE
mmetsp:Transcript_25031/g.46687  ORF Transcript_25031/g.46687 Transcript_25031/m.46687 type:complete len:186 (-) Transcript_25031:131-688(-)